MATNEAIETDRARSTLDQADRARVCKLKPAAQRALAEAAERRKQFDEAAAARPPERDGCGGTDPVRYGDWEVKGIASDF